MTRAVTTLTPARRRPALRVLERIAAEPWAIREPVLREIVAIAARAQSDPQAVALVKAEPAKGSRTTGLRDGVAIIPVQGPIFRYANLFTEVSGATSLEVFARDFGAAVADPSVKGIVLDVDSPGGQLAGTGEMAGIIAKAREKKPIVAHVDFEASSGAYYLASAASEIVAAPSAMLGSIGVVMTHTDTSKQDEMLGVKETEIVSSQSPHKRDTPDTEGGRERMQALVDQWADLFVEDVAAYRGVGKREVLSDFGKGGSLIGASAVAAGMADRLGSFEKTLRYVASGRAAESPRRRGAPGASSRRDWRAWQAAMAGEGGKSIHIIDPTGATNMAGASKWEQFKAMFRDEPPASADDDYDDPPRPTAQHLEMISPANPVARAVPVAGLKPTESPEVKALREELAAERTAREADRAERERERQAVQVERERTAAEAWAKEEIRAGRAVPAQAATLQALHAQAARDDRERPIEGHSRVAALAKLQSEVKPHGLEKPRVFADGKAEADAWETLPVAADSPGYDPDAEAHKQNDKYLGQRRKSS